MKNLYLRYLSKTCVFAATVFLSTLGWAQSGANLSQGSGFVGLRHVSINQITTSDFLCDSSYFYLNTDSLSDTWSLDEKAIFEYDNRGREQVKVISAFKEGAWIKKQQIRSAYISDFLNTQKEYAWNEKIEDWIPHTQHVYDYNYLGLIYEIKTMIHKNAEWIANSKIIYKYNAEFLVEMESHYLWNDSLMEWNSDSRNLYVYNEEQDLSKEILQIWVDSIGQWVNKTSEIYSFDNSDNVSSSTTRIWDVKTGSWINNSRSSFEYNAEGQPLSSAIEVLDAQNNGIPKQSEQVDYDESGNFNQLVTSFWDDER